MSAEDFASTPASRDLRRPLELWLMENLLDLISMSSDVAAGLQTHSHRTSWEQPELATALLSKQIRMVVVVSKQERRGDMDDLARKRPRRGCKSSSSMLVVASRRAIFAARLSRERMRE
ncbi:hypothetical protein L1887_58173 [Cichorium endivia]|nr:hypothetical protein L1887_58173 [Cichorium endivia]